MRYDRRIISLIYINLHPYSSIFNIFKLTMADHIEDDSLLSGLSHDSFDDFATLFPITEVLDIVDPERPRPPTTTTIFLLLSTY